MATLTQQPTLISATTEKLISGATAVSIFAQTGNSTISGNGSFVLAQGVGVAFESNGNVLGDITVTPAEGATALISLFK